MLGGMVEGVVRVPDEIAVLPARARSSASSGGRDAATLVLVDEMTALAARGARGQDRCRPRCALR